MKNIRWIANQARALTVTETNYEVLVSDLNSNSYVTKKRQATFRLLKSFYSICTFSRIRFVF